MEDTTIKTFRELQAEVISRGLCGKCGAVSLFALPAR
jgi:hypothetical protein